MAAVYKTIKLVDTSSQMYSVAVVDVDGEEVEVNFWYSLIDQWGKEDTKKWLCAEALWSFGQFQSAIDLLKDEAVGTVTKDTDTRNWQQNWLDHHHMPATQVQPEVDPLA